MKFLIVFIAVLIAVAMAPHAIAATLEWDANPDAKTYQVYYKAESATNWLTLGEPTDDTKIVIPSMPTFTENYLFSVKSFNECGNSSDFSEPVKFNPCMNAIVNTVKKLRISIQFESSEK